ncbi:hypothetical protein CLAFUW4_08619 [Fulvia fulva]|uniref:Protein CFT1 n=1 Tax=Passalora fulva TaxID=5499 RepID=A0A9Q8LF33_PASFU|nr:uncharacterized protein CLAFUR5_08720 [Fulvia fulva]KAK4630456.1 hypothetical protein CLAFUR0_08617 [Fulvia fulva]UJO15518.1 hypothetical protein CLAFUR5_08720 [Fulvia fulva]WPV12478.1 hypothetical protein CLAFUW4_08619 [Fulvia fulva]
MQCYTELLPPTAVTHALSLPFLNAGANNLIVAKTSLLQVFNVATFDGRDKLVLVGEYSLSGTITNLARVKLPDTKAGGDALLLAFKDAKLSLIEWDQENHRISTISIHYYEGDNVVSQPFGPSLADCENILTVDPNWRCAALKFGTRQLAVLPFRQPDDELGVEEDEDAEPASATVKRTESIAQNVNGVVEQTPYKASFVLALSTLLEDIRYTVDLAFLYGYRESTLGILSSSVQRSSALLNVRRDVLEYRMFKLELEQGESTELQVVKQLPNSLWKVVCLPAPVGGALLIGTNSFVHVDQNAKVNSVAVNEFAKLESDRGMEDQSDLNLKLEGCSVEVLDAESRQLLVVLHDGSLVTIYFQLSGRSIQGLKVSRVASESGGDLIKAAPSCVARVDDNKVFVGSEDGASSLVRWSRHTTGLSKKRSHGQMLGQTGDEEEEEVVEDDDDDLYDAAPESKKRATSTDGVVETAPSFQIQDELDSLGPINDICLGRSGEAQADRLQLMLGTGRGRSSRVSCLNRDIVPISARKSALGTAKSAWAVHAKRDDPEEDGYDNLLFAYDGQDTKIYDVDEVGYMERTAQEFEHEGETIDVQTLAKDTIIVQCRRSEIRTYDADLALSQIIPMVDEETDEEYGIVHLSFCDPYLLVIRDDSSVQVLQVQGKEIEPLEGEGDIAEKKWLSGSIHAGSLTKDEPVLFLLSAQGSMHIFSLPTLEPVYHAPALPHLPPVLSSDMPQRRAGPREALTELLVVELGTNGVDMPYVLARTALDDLVLYEPFHHPATASVDAWYTNLRFSKVPITYIPKYNEAIAQEESTRPPPLRCIEIGAYNAVTIPGSPPLLLVKEASSLPRVLEVKITNETNHVASLLPIHLDHCKMGFAALGVDGSLEEYHLPLSTWYGTGWSVQQVDLGPDDLEVRHLAYHENRGVYVVATCKDVDFYFAEDDHRHLGQSGGGQDDIALRPQVKQYSIHTVSSKTHRIIGSYDMPYLEAITALKVMPLEVSELTHDNELRILISTAAMRGEDMPAKGAIMVFNLIDVVPEPDSPESGIQLHLDAREETKGAITALAPFPGGFVGTGQGQKIMIRGLKEDGTCLPVAFLDAQCHTTTMKTLGKSGMWLAGDAWKGLWFGGFTEEPYKLTVLGKAPKTQMEVVAADFLPFDGALYILIVDADMDLHVLQYDPENPKSQNGMRLLHRSTFHLGHFATNMMLLPSSLNPFGENQTFTNGDTGDAPGESSPLFHVLTTSLTGSIGMITPLDESSYRRLSALQTHLTTILEHPASLNPRAYRAIESESFGGARGVVDGNIVRRINELGAARRADVLGRAGADNWSIRSDLEVVGGGGLGYL